MPTYQYRCQDCGHTFDVSMSVRQKEAGLGARCPECRSTRTKQVFKPLMFLVGRSGATRSSTCGPNCGPGCCGRRPDSH